MVSKRFCVNILKKAKYQVDQTIHYIANELCNPDAASNLLKSLYNEIENVSMFPYSMPIIKLVSGLKYEYRKCIVKNFAFIYNIDEEKEAINIRAFYYGPSNVIYKLLSKSN